MKVLTKKNRLIETDVTRITQINILQISVTVYILGVATTRGSRVSLVRLLTPASLE